MTFMFSGSDCGVRFKLKMYAQSIFITEVTNQKQEIIEKLRYYSHIRQLCWLSMPWKIISE